jgi:DNA-binding IclR family transcriptional regulator
LNELVHAVERALNILLCFTPEAPELSMTQISDKLRLHKSTVHRLLGTLEQMRFVERDPLSGLYSPGVRLLRLASLAQQKNELRQVAMPYMRKLCEQTNETVDLSVLDSPNVIFVDVVESTQRVKLAAAPGESLPAFSTASGKSILAFLPDAQVKRILEMGPGSFPSVNPPSGEKLWDELRFAREHGFALDEQGFENGINAVGAPIFDESGVPIGSIAVAGPSFRLPRERLIEIGGWVIAATGEVNRALNAALRA